MLLWGVKFTDIFFLFQKAFNDLRLKGNQFLEIKRGWKISRGGVGKIYIFLSEFQKIC
ncbi:Uncharacterized protein dnm_082120 [Desulfonema magnum]|uniref:Uncharacterized protein n=1 Tax=Desulfonema magnum TaxID=45655 RepID=A0A975BUR8_9BACT|nr:Uncharacterized protein dnm_082120 [Desulfonema magnum]